MYTDRPPILSDFPSPAAEKTPGRQGCLHATDLLGGHTLAERIESEEQSAQYWFLPCKDEARLRRTSMQVQADRFRQQSAFPLEQPTCQYYRERVVQQAVTLQ